MSALPSYGTHEASPESLAHKPSTKSGMLGYDGPVLLLGWFLLAELFAPLLLVHNLALAIIAVVLCLVQTVFIYMETRAVGKYWWWYGVISLMTIASAAVLGFILRPAFIESVTFDGRTVGHPPSAAVVACCAVLSVTLACMMLCSWILPMLGVRIIGSSPDVNADGQIAFRPNKASVMDFGYSSLDDEVAWLEGDTNESYRPRLCYNLLNTESFWSGEFVLDYAFHVANEHLFLACLFCHPAHPYEKFERFFVMIVVCVLIVFPVAAFSVCMPNGILRILLQAILITAPRNILKFWLMDMSTKEDAAILAKHKRISRETLLTVHEEMLLRNAFHELLRLYTFTATATILIAIFCCLLIKSHNAPVRLTLVQNVDGLLFAFYLDLVFDLVMPNRTQGGTRCFGFFNRWTVARKEANDDDQKRGRWVVHQWRTACEVAREEHHKAKA